MRRFFYLCPEVTSESNYPNYMFYQKRSLRRYILCMVFYAILNVLAIGRGKLYAQSTRDVFAEQFRKSADSFKKDHVGKLSAAQISAGGPLASIAHKINEAKHYAQIQDAVNLTSDNLFSRAIVEAKAFGDEEIIVFALAQRGYYYYRMRKVAEAMPDLMEAMLILDRNPKLVPVFPEEVYKQLGYFFGGIDEYKNGIKFLLKSLTYTVDDLELATIYDNLGMYALNVGNNQESQGYLDKAWEYVLKANDQVRKAKILGSFALLEKQRGDYARSIELLKEDVEISRKNNAELNTLFASNLLADLLIHQGQLEEARRYLMAVKPFADRHASLVGHRNELNEHLLKIAMKTGDEKSEVRLRRLLAAMKDTVNLFDGDLVNEQTRWRAEKEIINEDLRKATVSYSNVRNQVLYGLLVISFLVLVSLAFVWRSFRNRKEAARLSAFNSDDDQKNISSVTIASTVDIPAVKDVEKEPKETEVGIRVYLSKILSGTMMRDEHKGDGRQPIAYLSTEESWDRFKHRFVLEYSAFYIALQRDFPELSEGNMRVVLLWKLKLNSREIGQLLGVSADAVKKTKQRLRKKLGDPRYKELVDFIEAFEQV